MAQIFPNLPVISRVVAAVIIIVFAFMSNQVGVALATYQTQQHFAQTTRNARSWTSATRSVLFLPPFLLRLVLLF